MASESTTVPLPPPSIQIAVVSRDGFQILTKEFASHSKYRECTGSISYSNQGNLLSLPQEERVAILDTNLLETSPGLDVVSDNESQNQQIFDPAIKMEIKRKNVVRTQFSPKDNFLVTWEMYQKPRENEQPGNLLIWDVETGKEYRRIVAKLSPDHIWPLVQWSKNQSIYCHMVTNSLQIREGNSICGPILSRLQLEGITQFSICPYFLTESNDVFIALFRPAKKDKPATIKIYNYPSETVVITKSVFRAQSASFKWCPTAESILVQTRCDEDITGRSYYGETNLFFIRTNTGSTGTVPSTQVPGDSYSCSLNPDNEGSIEDVSYSPNGREIILIHGFSPPKVSVYDSKKCDILYEFGRDYVNNVRFSPHGHYIVLGGFGNNNGQIHFVSVKKYRKISQQEHQGARFYEWAPDGYTFVTAVMHPWLRVDNCIRIWRPDGKLLKQEDFVELHQVIIKPTLPKGSIPPPAIALSHKKSTNLNIFTSSSKTSTPAYVPPHLRNKNTDTTKTKNKNKKIVSQSEFEAEAEKMRQFMRQGASTTTSTTSGQSKLIAHLESYKPPVRLPIGATETISSKASKNKKKRERDRKKRTEKKNIQDKPNDENQN